MAVITQEQLSGFKKLFPNDAKLQAVTYDELLRNTGGGAVDWKKVPMPAGKGVELAGGPLECGLAVGFVVIDVICLALGAVALRASFNRVAAQAVADAVKPVISALEGYVAKIAAQGASFTDMAWGVFGILKTIWSGGCLGAVISSFFSTLAWYYWVLYGATGLATIVAAVTTDGVAFVALVVVELATFGFLVADSIAAVSACSWQLSAPTASKPVVASAT